MVQLVLTVGFADALEAQIPIFGLCKKELQAKTVWKSGRPNLANCVSQRHVYMSYRRCDHHRLNSSNAAGRDEKLAKLQGTASDGVSWLSKACQMLRQIEREEVASHHAAPIVDANLIADERSQTLKLIARLQAVR